MIALGLVFAYAMKPDRFYLMMCAVPVVILLFCNAYLLGAVRRRRARQLAKKKGTYGIELRKSGICAGKDWTFYPLKDRRWELLNSEHVYAIKVDKEVSVSPKE